MSVERIEQTKEVGVFEITVAINNPLKVGELDYLDRVITKVLDNIESFSIRLGLRDVQVLEK